MSIIIVTLRRLLRLLWAVFAWCTVAAAVLLTALRLLLPLGGHYKNELVHAVTESLGQPLRVAAFEPEWHGLGPEFVLKGVQLLDARGARPILSLREVRVGIDLVNSLMHRRLEDSHLTLSGVDITLVRHRDGRLGIEGFGAAAAGATTRQVLDKVQAWLQAQRRITIADGDVYWHDERGGRPSLHFAHVELGLRNNGQHHEVSGSALLPTSLGHTLEVALSFRGPLLDTRRWAGDLYVKGSALDLATLHDRGVAGIAITQGLLDVRAWGSIQAGGLRDLQGEVQVNGLRLAALPAGGSSDTAHVSRGAAMRIEGLGARFHWRAYDQGWIVDADRFWLAEGGVVTPETQFRVFTRLGDGETEIETQFGYLRLQDAAALVSLSNKGGAALHDMIDVMKPTGEVRHVYFHLNAAAGAPPRPFVYVQFADLVTHAPWRGMPAIGGLNGFLEGSPDAGDLDLNSRSVSVPRGLMLRNAVNIDRLKGRISWRRTGRGWRISSPRFHVQNQDITADARFTVRGGPDSPRPFVDVVADFSNGDIAHVSRYLPAAKMRPHAVKWLDRALAGGKITSGAAVLHGRLADFPFDHHEGVFAVRFAIDDGVLDYREQWPRVSEIQAKVRFDGRRLSVEASHGRILHSIITGVHAHIDDLAAKPPVLSITGKAAGPTRDALYVATHTPLEQKIGRFLKDATATGGSTLSLSLGIPFSPAPKQVRGTLVFNDSGLTLGNKLDLTHIDGPLSFTHKGLHSSGIRARLVGYPATIEAGTVDADGSHIIYFAGHGRTDVPNLERLQFLHLPFIKYVNGQTSWTARLTLKESLRDKRTRVSLEVHSGMQGMSVDLPAPLAKVKQDKVPLTVNVDDIGQAPLPVFFRYGDRLSGAMMITSTGKGQAIDRGSFRFSDGDARLPKGRGIAVSGRLQRFSLAQWRGYFPAADGAGGEGLLNRLVDVDVRVKALQAFGWGLHGVALEAHKRPRAWSVKIKCGELAGNIDLSRIDGDPTVIDLDYLHLRPGALHGEGGDVDPARLPSVRLASKQVTYDGKQFGRLKLMMTKEPQGVHIDQLAIESDSMKITASGDWTKDAHGQASAFAADITSNDIGGTLSRFGYVGTIKGGKGTAQVNASWSGSPTDMDVKTLDGALVLSISKGRLLDVDPGAGRILGILSLQALPRRLTLDFSDLFEKGFSFDYIRGDFAIHNGDAYTDNLQMEGPAARFDVVGHVGLVRHDYDQTVTVTPHYTSSLPLASVIASGAGVIASGVGVGVAILVLQKIFEDQIDEITRVQYTVTGPWKKPVVEPLAKKAKHGKDEKS